MNICIVYENLKLWNKYKINRPGKKCKIATSDSPSVFNVRSLSSHHYQVLPAALEIILSLNNSNIFSSQAKYFHWTDLVVLPRRINLVSSIQYQCRYHRALVTSLSNLRHENISSRWLGIWWKVIFKWSLLNDEMDIQDFSWSSCKTSRELVLDHSNSLPKTDASGRFPVDLLVWQGVGWGAAVVDTVANNGI